MRKICESSITAALAAAILMATTPQPTASQVELVIVDTAVVAKGYRMSKLIGSSVVNDKSERIGTIDDVVVNRDRLLFAVLQVGGFLHIGGHLVAVPYQSLVLDESGDKITLPGATPDELKKLPEFKYAS